MTFPLEIHLLTPDPELMSDRVNTVNAIMSVVGLIAEQHGLEEALLCIYLAAAHAEHIGGVEAPDARKGIASTRAMARRLRKRIGDDASAGEIMIEAHIVEREP